MVGVLVCIAKSVKSRIGHEFELQYGNIILFCLILYISVNNFSVMLGRVFLG